MNKPRTSLILLFAAVFAGSGAPSLLHAQQRIGEQKTRQQPAPARKEVPEPEAPPPETPPPYEPQILKLAEIMGAIAFLANLCKPPEAKEPGDVWRGKALEFLNAEPLSPARRERFAGAYNRGFQSYGVVYRTCTPNARLSIDRLMIDGAKLTREISSRFGS